ncbi:hypothetical protein BDY24DRAFT_64307 [Mrakia frigida]|uniref:uncharacterized protein n=1 Tax=Mrakia frigida TaxID=29902 RepID=UPI003FCC1745
MWKNASWNASQGRIILGRNEIMGLRTQIGRFIHYVHTTVQTLMNRPQQNDQQRQLQQQQFLQQQQLQAQQQLQQAAALQQQQQENQSQLATNLPDPSTFAGRLRPEDLRAPPPSKRARTSSVGGIASPSPAATTPAELRTPINAEQSPPANGKSPASSKKGTPKAAGNKKEKPSAGNRKSSTSGTGRSTLDQVKEELEKRDREEDVVEVPSQGPSVPTGVVATDPASVLGLQMDGWEERRRQEEVRAAAKDPVSFFQSQWNNLHQAQIDASNAGGVPNTFHDGGGGPNGLDHTALARAMRDIRQPSTYGSSSSSSYPIASTSSLPYNSLGYSSNSIQDSNRPASPKSPVEDFDISFFLDASQYEDEEEADEEIVAPTEDDGGAGNSQGSSSRKVGSSSSSDPRPIDAQTPDLLHSSGPHDESPASVKEAISPPRLLPFRSSNTNATASTSDSANLPPPLTNRSTPNPFARNNSISANPSSADASAESLSVLIPSSIAGDTNPSSSKSISPLPLQTPLGENGMEIWSEMGEDSYFSGGGVGGGFDWEGTQLEGTNGSSGWLINSS